MSKLPERINVNDETYIRSDAISDMTKPVRPVTWIYYVENVCNPYWADAYKCPYCSAGWGSAIVSSKFNFCPQCGVKIDREYALSVRSALNKAIKEGIELIKGESGDDLIRKVESCEQR